MLAFIFSLNLFLKYVLSFCPVLLLIFFTRIKNSLDLNIYDIAVSRPCKKLVLSERHYLHSQNAIYTARCAPSM